MHFFHLIIFSIYEAGKNVAGEGSIALGYQALAGASRSNTGSQNTAVGYQSMLVITSGHYNTAIGYQFQTPKLLLWAFGLLITPQVT